MMGRTVIDPQHPDDQKAPRAYFSTRVTPTVAKPEPCIRCAACVNVCPMGLEPFLLSTLSRLKQYDEAEQEKIANCIECGSCSYICPSSRPILDFIRVGKGKVMAAMRARAAAAK